MFVMRKCALALGALAITAVSFAVLSSKSPGSAAEPTGDDASLLVAQAGKRIPKRPIPPKKDPPKRTAADWLGRNLRDSPGRRQPAKRTL